MGWPNDGVAAFFLICFFVGLLFTVGSFFLGLGHGGAGVHAGAGHGLAGGHLHIDGGHAGIGAGQSAGGGGPGAGDARVSMDQGGPPVFNVSTAMAFLTWFGGAGYILRIYYGAALPLALGVAGVAGIAGAALVFAFLSRVLYASQWVLDPNDYHLPGTLARITSPIRAGGTGEIVYVKGDTRQVAGARGVDGGALERGAEVVIMRYERGIAYVQRWDDLMRPEEQPSEEQPEEPSTPAGR